MTDDSNDSDASHLLFQSIGIRAMLCAYAARASANHHSSKLLSIVYAGLSDMDGLNAHCTVVNNNTINALVLRAAACSNYYGKRLVHLISNAYMHPSIVLLGKMNEMKESEILIESRPNTWAVECLCCTKILFWAWAQPAIVQFIQSANLRWLWITNQLRSISTIWNTREFSISGNSFRSNSRPIEIQSRLLSRAVDLSDSICGGIGLRCRRHALCTLLHSPASNRWKPTIQLALHFVCTNLCSISVCVVYVRARELIQCMSKRWCETAG